MNTGTLVPNTSGKATIGRSNEIIVGKGLSYAYDLLKHIIPAAIIAQTVTLIANSPFYLLPSYL